MEKLFLAVREILHGIENYHDSYTLLHEKSTGKLMYALAASLGFDDNYCFNMEQVGSIHDIGKLALPPMILDKPTKLSAYEREVIKLHPIIGSKMLEKINHPLAFLAAIINLEHHEAYDGSGYPKGLKQDQISIEARICSVCDVYDALRTQRPYREATTEHDQVIKKMLSKESYGMFNRFDPEILDAFSSIHQQAEEIYHGCHEPVLGNIH